MSKISNAILDTLLETVTDFEEVSLTKKQKKELQDICDRWKDEDSIETEICYYIRKIGYESQEDCRWVKK